MTASAATARPAAVPRVARPCVGTDDGACCVAGFLLGVACCPDGTCALCREILVRARRDGRPPEEARRRLAAARRGLLRRCPACGFSPPPPLADVPALPRLDRTERTESDAWNCRVCGKALTRGRRRFCSQRCYQNSEAARVRA